MPITIEERTALAAYQAAQVDVRNTITNGVLPNTVKALEQYAAFSAGISDPANVAMAAQYAAELAEVGLTADDLGELVAALTALVALIHAKDEKAGGRLFYLPQPESEELPE